MNAKGIRHLRTYDGITDSRSFDGGSIGTVVEYLSHGVREVGKALHLTYNIVGSKRVSLVSQALYQQPRIEPTLVAIA